MLNYVKRSKDSVARPKAEKKYIINRPKDATDMTKLCARGKSAAKRKFKVYPSAYANAYASKICAGKKIKDPSGTKKKRLGT